MFHVYDFFFSVICVLIDLAQIDQVSASLFVEVDQVFCFSILHYQVIYSGKFLRLILFCLY